MNDEVTNKQLEQEAGGTPRFKVGEIVRIVRGDYHVDNIAKILEVLNSRHGF